MRSSRSSSSNTPVPCSHSALLKICYTAPLAPLGYPFGSKTKTTHFQDIKTADVSIHSMNVTWSSTKSLFKQTLKRYAYDRITFLQRRELGVCRTRLGVRAFCVCVYVFVFFCLLFGIIWILYHVTLSS